MLKFRVLYALIASVLTTTAAVASVVPPLTYTYYTADIGVYPTPTGFRTDLLITFDLDHATIDTSQDGIVYNEKGPDAHLVVYSDCILPCITHIGTSSQFSIGVRPLFVEDIFTLTYVDASGYAFNFDLPFLSHGSFTGDVKEGLSVPSSDIVNDPNGTNGVINGTLYRVADIEIERKTIQYSVGRPVPLLPYPSVPSVPIPSTAPLFGAAVLLLGLAGYGTKRARLPKA